RPREAFLSRHDGDRGQVATPPEHHLGVPHESLGRVVEAAVGADPDHGHCGIGRGVCEVGHGRDAIVLFCVRCPCGPTIAQRWGWPTGRIWEAGEIPAQARCGEPSTPIGSDSASPKTGLASTYPTACEREPHVPTIYPF